MPTNTNILVGRSDFDAACVIAVADEGSGGDSSWLDLGDSNSSTISSGGVFSDLVRDQEHDLVAADSTRHEDLAGLGSLGLGSLGGAGSAEPAEHPEPPSGRRYAPPLAFFRRNDVTTEVTRCSYAKFCQNSLSGSTTLI